ncbi:anti-sigma factor [Qipengyuania sp. YG27]|uniref:Anti-sigma factor n=1 Tax=Qipengyuania mesophila TaxID=2867246 RepID=A0ABS7JVK8_9SPHN|nr:anti-sigma factor [Qipengyuania mesophila]MBX7501692.1 anti-sigma factor [Qipengyuania mesophila]
MVERRSLDDLEVMAAGLALGLLDEGERAEALRRKLRDPDFADRVRAWQETADRWLEDVDPVEAPTGALSSIETLLDQRNPRKEGQPMDGDRRAADRWRILTMTASAASLVLAVGLSFVLLTTDRTPNNAAPQVAEAAARSANIAQIRDAGGAPLLSALYNPGSGTLSLRLADLQQPDFGPELWIIPQDGVPRSLGMVDDERLTITLSPRLRSYLRDGATMAITIEPRDDAPHDAPSGDILGTATLQEVPAATT